MVRHSIAKRMAVLLPALLIGTAALAAGVSVIPEAAYSGERGMRIILNNPDPGYVEDDSPNALQQYRARFWINLDNLTLADGEEYDVLQALNNGNEIQFRIRIRRFMSTNRLNVEVRDDSGTLLGFNANGEGLIAGGWNAIEVNWQAATGVGQNDGLFQLFLNGSEIPGFNGIDSDQRQIDKVRLGFADTTVTNFSDVSGSFDLDEFVSRQSDAIGQTPTTTGISDVTVTEGAPDTVIDLFAAFRDEEDADADLAFTVQTNTNAALFDNVSIDGAAGTLTLSYSAAKAVGTSDITVRATDTNNLFVETTFTVTVNPPPPTKASNPEPADNAVDVARDANLSWTAGDNADSHDVYFGTTNPPPAIGNQAGTTYDPGNLDADTTYFWRVDEVNASGTTQGDVWSFTTAPEAPGQATAPMPNDMAEGVSPIDLELSWTAGARAVSHDVYFGTTNPPALIGNQAEVTFSPADPEGNTTYFWRIDEVNPGGTTTGVVWTFTTSAALFGDVNGDEVVDAVDIQLVINNALGVANTPGADLNGDMTVDAVDVQLIINAVLGV